MKKNISLLILLFAFCRTAHSQVQIQVAAPGLQDVCGPNIAMLEVISPQVGFTYTWYIDIQGNCGTGINNLVGSGTTYFVQSTGYYYCYATPTGGGSPLSSNTIPVRVLPNTGMTVLHGNLSCVASAVLCIPNVYYTWGGDVIKWYKNNVLLNGVTSSSYTATSNGYYKYSIASTNVLGLCSATTFSDSVLVTIATAHITYSGLTTFCSGGNVQLNANLGAGYTYQWKNNGTNISGATLATYSATISGIYTCAVTSACGTLTSNSITVTVFTSAPVSAIIYSGPTSGCSAVPMEISGGFTSGFTYQWQENFVNISGATSYGYSAQTSAMHRCIVSNACGSTITNTLNPNIYGTSSISATNNTTLCSGTVTLLLPGFSFMQWYRNGIEIEGANSNTLSITGSGVYNCLITTSCGSLWTPNSITVSGPASITALSSLTFCNGGSVTLQANSQSTVSSYQWKLNGSNITGATASNYVATLAGNYTCAVNNSQCGAHTSNSLNVSVGSTPQVSLIYPQGIYASEVSLCGPAATIYAIPANAGTYTLFEYNLGSPILSQTSNTFSLSETGVYYMQLDNGCGTTQTLPSPISLANTTSHHAIVSSGSTNVCSANTPVLYIAPYSLSANGHNYLVPFWHTYNWKLNGVSIAAPAGTASSVFPTQTGWYSCTVTNDCGTAQQVDSLFITYNQTPTATVTPAGPVSLCTGQNVVLSVTTTTGASYQWKRNSINLSGGTSSSYTATLAGNYTVVVTKNSCSATSSTVVVTVGAGATATVTPSGTVSFCAGSSVTLNANTGTGIAYQWYKSGVAQAGATSASYLIGNAGTYYVVETSSCGTATSNSVVVTQINNPNPTMSYTTPTTFCSPGTITFTANTFTGVTYQWQKNSIDIAGATAQTYAATTNGKYRVKQTANGCTKQGQDVQVTTATSVTAIIAANGPVTFCAGGSVVLSVSNSIPGYSYQWKNNGVNIAGATTSSYTATTAGTYTCYVSASCGNATSNTITVSTGGIVALVNPSGTVNICNGATVAMSANTGTGFAFQWKKNGTNISGATSASYNATTAGAYTVAITSPCGNATSTATNVAITTLTATASPASTTICNGSAATFTANTGYNYTYQWYRAGIAIAGATASTHANSTAGNYTVVITQGGVCSATSNIAALTVISNPNPTVTLSGPTTFCAGQSVTITANTFAGVTYQWIKGSTNLAGATSQAYTATTAGQYNVKETANGCTKQMGVPVVVTVNCKLGNDVILENSDDGIKVVPNPFTNEFTVSGLVVAVGDKLQMINVLGEIVLNETVSNTTSPDASGLKLQTSNFPSGIYFLQVKSALGMKTIKVVKQ